TTSGVAHRAFSGEAACLAGIRELLSFLPQNNTENPPAIECKDQIAREEAALVSIVPADSMKPYDIKGLISRVDDGRFFEIQPEHAQNIVVGFARIEGRSVGIVANQPDHLAGVLDIDSSV